MSGKRLPSSRFKGTWVKLMIQSNLDYPDSLGPHEIVRIIENMNVNEEQNRAKLIKFRKRRLIVKHQFYKSFGIQYGLHLHFHLLWKERIDMTIVNKRL